MQRPKAPALAASKSPAALSRLRAAPSSRPMQRGICGGSFATSLCCCHRCCRAMHSGTNALLRSTATPIAVKRSINVDRFADRVARSEPAASHCLTVDTCMRRTYRRPSRILRHPFQAHRAARRRAYKHKTRSVAFCHKRVLSPAIMEFSAKSCRRLLSGKLPANQRAAPSKSATYRYCLHQITRSNAAIAYGSVECQRNRCGGCVALPLHRDDGFF